MKSYEEVMEILEAFDLTRSFRDAAELAGCSHHTVADWVAKRDRGELPVPGEITERPKLIDPFLPKIEEWVDRSDGKIRADVVFDRLVAVGFAGSARTVRRAVAGVKGNYKRGNRRVYRPWIAEPGMWAQWDWGKGPIIGGRATNLFCAWFGWSRFRVVIPTWDRTMADRDRLFGPGDARRGRGADVLADRQREDGDGRSRGRGPGPEPGGRRGRSPLRGHDRDVRPVRSRVQGRRGSDRADREGGPGPDRRQPPSRLPGLG